MINRNEIDLCGWEENGAHLMMAMTKDWSSTSVPYKNAVLNLGPQLLAQFPDVFTDIKDVTLWFMTTHAFNMSRHANNAGMSYPIALSANLIPAGSANNLAGVVVK